MNSPPDLVINSPENIQAVSLNPFQIIAEVWQRRQLFRQLTKRSVQQRFRGSMLGIVWAILNPICMLLVYTFVFSIVLKVQWNGQGSHFVFAMNLFCGLIVYGIFSESVGAASTQIVTNPSYVKKIVFPLELLPLASMGAAIIFNLFSLAILLACTQFFMHPLSIHLAALPVIWLPLFLLTAGLSLLVAALGVFLRDIGQLIVIILQIVFYLCPIVYPMQRLSQLPPRVMQWYLLCNPMAVFLEESRRVILQGVWPIWSWLPASYAVSLLLFIFGYYAFMKTKRGFADVI
jgi:lipopolysaccharide transport system permease protein